MAQLPTPFDATQVEPTSTFEAIPAGNYTMRAVNSEMKTTRNGDGQYLQIEMEVIGGQYAGRKVWERLNLVNPNATATEIAQRTLSAICHAVGKMHIRDSVELHGTPFTGIVKHVPADGRYAAKNEMAGYKRAEGAAQTAQPPASTAQLSPAVAQPPATTAPPAPPTAPWLQS